MSVDHTSVDHTSVDHTIVDHMTVDHTLSTIWMSTTRCRRSECRSCKCRPWNIVPKKMSAARLEWTPNQFSKWNCVFSSSKLSSIKRNCYREPIFLLPMWFGVKIFQLVNQPVVVRICLPLSARLSKERCQSHKYFLTAILFLFHFFNFRLRASNVALSVS